jgi:hypothetical protein
MSSGPPTSLTLISRVQQHEDGVWSRFVDVYEPVMRAFLGAKGLQDADACDVTQEALRGVADRPMAGRSAVGLTWRAAGPSSPKTEK